MREIKYRGYSKLNNTWYYGLLGKFVGKYFIECDGGAKPFVDEASIGQFTGFKDKNGKEIYEGDIIKYDKHTDKIIYFNYPLLVYFDEEVGIWMAYDNEEEENTRLHFINYECEIIGNIYEEKLKEGK